MRSRIVIAASSLAICPWSSRSATASIATLGRDELGAELVRVLVREVELPHERADEVGAREPAELGSVARLRRATARDGRPAAARLGLEAACAGACSTRMMASPSAASAHAGRLSTASPRAAS